MSGSRKRGLHVANKLGLACVAATCFLAACGDSDDSGNETPRGGAAGSSGKAGSGGKAGSSAGHGGASAGSGQAGEENVAGETGDGGEAGETGSTAGSGGSAGGGVITAGAGGSTAGSGGVGGSAGGATGGSGGAPVTLVPNCVRDTTSGKKVEISALGNDGLFAAAYGPDGKLYAAGYTQPGTGASEDRATVVVRLTDSGAIDTTWAAATGGIVTVNVKVTSGTGGQGELPRGLAFQGSKIIVAGTVETYATAQTNTAYNADRDVYVLRLNADGSLDNTFGDTATTVPTPGIHILPLNAGVLNTAGTGVSGADAQWGLNVLPDNKIIVTAATRNNGMTTDTVPVPRTDTDFAVVKLTADGAQDATFGLVGGTPGVFTLDVAQSGASVRTASVLSDGKLIITGYSSYGGSQRPVIFKLLANGSALDPSFGAAGIFSEPVGTAAEAYGALVQASGKLVTVGYGRATAANTTSDMLSIRLTANGVLDTTYGTSGRTWFDVGGLGDNGRAIVLSDDRPVLFGGGSLSTGQQDAVITVLSTEGKTLGSIGSGGSGGAGGAGGSGGAAGPFTSFGTPFGCKAYDFGSIGDFFWAGAVAPNGKIAAVGLTGHVQGSTEDTDGVRAHRQAVKATRRQSAFRLKQFGRAAGLVTAGLLAALSCKSFVIDESVYTGATSSRPGSSSTGGGSSSPAAGGSQARAGSGVVTPGQDGGEVAANGGQSATGGGIHATGGGSHATAGSGGNDGGPLEPEIPEEPFSKAAFLRQVADCAVARYQDFELHAAVLDEAAKANLAAPSDATADAAKNAWLAANASWQVAEIFRFGPAARTADEDAGAQELRDQIYAWRFGARCPVETALVDKLYASSHFGSSLISNRGLGAAEYLLFYPRSDNQCPDYSAINKNGSWAALGATETAARKRAYAEAVAADVLENARKLLEAWDPAHGNFRQKLTQPGSGSVYPSEQAALNAVWHGIFYIEKEVKDYKLGIPLGVSECAIGLCPEALESRFANVSTANIRQNYLGFRRLFQGCGGNYSGLGFDDWLDAIGASDLRSRMLTALDGAQRAIDALDRPLEVSVSQNTDRVWAVYTALKQLTDLLKSEFVTVLDLELPAGAGSDND